MMDKTNAHHESGQAAALVALLMFLGLIAFAALALDGAMTYLVRRDLQNVADAAALAACTDLTNNGTNSSALITATSVVAANLGSYEPFVGANPPSTNIGTGQGLVQGIEVSDPQVRVAVHRTVPTVLTQFLGRGDSIMVAQARCDLRAGGGLMPIAVQRYDGGTGGTMTDYIANKTAPIYPTDSAMVTISSPPARYPPSFQVPVPLAQYTASDGALADTNTGPEVLLLGQSAETNNNTSSMRDLVLLDIRNVGSQTALEYYNGADSQADAAKDMSQNWIYQHGYPGPYPEIGSQVAILDGASNNFTARAMDTAGYRPGDVVATIVYDGYVWTVPDYKVTLTPAANNGIATTLPVDSSTAVAYTINIVKDGPQDWAGLLNFNLFLNFSNGPAPTGTQITLNGNPVTPDVGYTILNVPQAGWTGTLRIWNTDAITIGQYLTGLNLGAQSSLGLWRGSSSNFGFGAIATNDYSARTDSTHLDVRQGASNSVGLITFGVGTALPNSGQGCSAAVHADILLNSAIQPWGTYFSSAQNSTVRIRRNQDKLVSLALNARSSAPTGDYVVRVTVNSPCNSLTIPAHSVDVPISIGIPAPTATPNRFVFIQGYAVFRISRVDANDVWGYAISPLYQSYNDIRIGLRPRLIPW